jgi:hypothetical protein
MTTNTNNSPVSEAQRGPAERLLDLVLSSGAHLWHNRPGIDDGGVWRPAVRRSRGAGRAAVQPGLFVPAAVDLYRKLLEIYQLNAELAAHFASYAVLETEWRDLKVACAALMLVQPSSGQPVRGDAGAVEFHDDDFRAVGQGMMLFYQKSSPRMLTPKGVLRVAQFLEIPQIAALNRTAGFADTAGRKAPLGRWKQAAARWLRVRESNLPMLQGLVAAGYKETIKAIARKAGYKPDGAAFFELLGWKQKQAAGGHRSVGLSGLKLVKRERFDGLSEAEICERIVEERLTYKDVVGRLPKEIGLTPAIMVACLPSLSDRDLRILTPTLEELGLLGDPDVRARWEAAVASSTDQRALNVAKNVKGRAVREKLQEAADHAARKAVAAASTEVDLHVMFLIDKSGSMGGAIDRSKEALSRILAGFPPEKLHIASFDTMGTVLRPKAPTRAAVQHMLAKIQAAGGTIHGSAVRALHSAGVRVPTGARLVVIVAGDEAGEDGAHLARAFQELGYPVAGMALICAVAHGRGSTVRQCAQALRVGFAEVDVAQFDDPYQVPRVLRTLLEAPVPTASGGAPAPQRASWVDKIMQTPLLGPDGKPLGPDGKPLDGGRPKAKA